VLQCTSGGFDCALSLPVKSAPTGTCFSSVWNARFQLFEELTNGDVVRCLTSARFASSGFQERTNGDVVRCLTSARFTSSGFQERTNEEPLPLPRAKTSKSFAQQAFWA
jgi:hypothetical protein